MASNKLLLNEMFKLLNVDLTTTDIFQVEIDFDTFQTDSIIDKIHSMIPIYKKKYKSNMLTCLHTNSLDKQAFPAINFFRQILKCNNMKLAGRYLNMGNDKTTGKKILKRVYSIVPIASQSLPPISTKSPPPIAMRPLTPMPPIGSQSAPIGSVMQPLPSITEFPFPVINENSQPNMTIFIRDYVANIIASAEAEANYSALALASPSACIVTNPAL
jgi:hypothetical protein